MSIFYTHTWKLQIMQVKINENLKKQWRDMTHSQITRLSVSTSGFLTLIHKFHMHACSVTQSCPTLCDPMNCSPPGSSVHVIRQARILEWAAISSSRGSPRTRDWTSVSCTPASAGSFLFFFFPLLTVFLIFIKKKKKDMITQKTSSVAEP